MFGKQDEARRLLVEPMDDAGTSLASNAPDIGGVG
jgi:hypothetical protein